MIGIIEQGSYSDGLSYIKFSSGIMMIMGHQDISANTQNGSSAIFKYTGTHELNLMPLGLLNILAAFASTGSSTAAWGNTSINSIDNTNKIVTLSLSDDGSFTRSIYYLIIGTWK